MIKKKIIFISIIILLLTVILFWIFMPFEIKYSDRIEMGNKIVKELDNFYTTNKKYPYSYDIRGKFAPPYDIEESDPDVLTNIYRKALLNDNIVYWEYPLPIYYMADKEYILIYHFGFDPPDLFYYSKTKKWLYDFPNKILTEEN